MGIIRKYEKFVRHYLHARNAAISESDEFKIVKYGTAADVNPDIATDAYNHYIEWEIGDYSGYTRVYRQDLTEFWRELHNTAYVRKLVIRSTAATCIHDILKDINEYTLLDLKPDDVVNTPLTDGEYNEITITVTPKCFWFTGSLTIPLQHKTVIVGGVPITKLPVTHKINSCANDPGAPTDSGRINFSALVYGDNYQATDALLGILPSEYYSNSQPYTISSADANKVIDALKSVSNVTAAYVNTANYPGINLWGAYVAYNGPVEGYTDLSILGSVAAQPNHYGSVIGKLNKPRQDREFVLVIVPNPQYSALLNYEPLFIHYGGEKPKTVERPPVHYWPLREDRLNRGTSEDKPRFLARGEFISREFGGRPSLVINHGNTSGPAGKYITPLGTELPVEGDWSISFDGAVNYYKAAIGTKFYLASVDANGVDRPQIYFSITAAGLISAIFDVGTPRLTITYPSNTGRSWPNWVTYTMVKRGDRLTIYKDGLLAVVYHGVGNAYTSFNSFMTYAANQALSIKDFRYFDYALDAQQVKRAIVGGLDPVYVPEPKREQPKPVHLWSLDGHGGDIGSKPTALNPIFGYREETKAADKKQYAYNTITGGSLLGVDLDVSKDFTLTFELGFYNPPSGYTELGDMFSGNGTHVLSFYGTSPYLKGSGKWDDSHINDSLVSTLTNCTYKVQLVRRGDWLNIYLNGRYVCTQKWMDKTTTVWNRFGGPTTLNSYLGIRNLTYYDVPLTDDELIVDSIDRVGMFTDNTPVSIPEPYHSWALTQDLSNTGKSGLEMKAPFKFVTRDTGNWATLTGGRTPQAFGPGIEFDRTGDWIIDFEIMVLSGPERNALFVTHLNKEWNGYPSVIALYYNKPYEVYGTGSDTHSKVLTNGVPARLTYRCNGGVTTMYMDGVEVVKYNNPTTGSFKGFRTADGYSWFPSQMPENDTFIRHLSYWNTSMSKREFEALLKRKPS